jgi:hypothetical protein
MLFPTFQKTVVPWWLHLQGQVLKAEDGLDRKWLNKFFKILDITHAPTEGHIQTEWGVQQTVFFVYLLTHTFNQSNSIICSFLFFLPLSYQTVSFSLNWVLNTKLAHELSGSF